MVEVKFEEIFLKKVGKIIHAEFRSQLRGQMAKIVRNPSVGKPMRSDRKGTREVYIGSHRLSYLWLAQEDVVVFLDLYHKDDQ